MAGERLAEMGLPPDDRPFGHFAVKEAVMPFGRFPGSDVVLGPEMKATGEHLGFNFYNLACVVEEGGRLELSAKSVGVMSSNTDSSFVNYGTLSLPQG